MRRLFGAVALTILLLLPGCGTDRPIRQAGPDMTSGTSAPVGEVTAPLTLATPDWHIVPSEPVCAKPPLPPLALTVRAPGGRFVPTGSKHDSRLEVELVNSTGQCDLPDEPMDVTGAGLQLQLVAAGAPDAPVASVALPRLNQHLEPGQAVQVAVSVKDVPPGYYKLIVVGQVQTTWRGNSITFTPEGVREGYGGLLFSDGLAPVGTYEMAPATLAGLTFPARLVLSGDSNHASAIAADVYARLPITCGNERSTVVVERSTGAVYASGANFRTPVPIRGDGSNPAQSERYWSAAAIPAETTGVELQMDIELHSCTQGFPLLERGTLRWTATLPSASADTMGR